METINNCTELLNHLYLAYNTSMYCCGGHIEFEGTPCEVWGAIPETNGLFIISPTFPNTIFVIGEEQNFYGEKTFNLYTIIGREFIIDQTLCVSLPIYVKDELIATIKGEW